MANKLIGCVNLIGPFSGQSEEDVEFFFKQFDDMAKIGNIKQEEKLTILKCKLKNEALKYVTSSNELKEETDYEVVRDKIIEYFKEETNLNTSQIKLSLIKQQKDEKIKALAHRIRNAVIDFSGTDIDSPKAKLLVDRMCHTKFVDSLNQNLQFEVVKLKPKNFENAVEIAQNLQDSLEVYETMRLKTKSEETQMESLINIISKQTDEDKQTIENLKQQVNSLTSQQPQKQKQNEEQPKPFCNFCGQNTHFEAFCFYKQKQQNPTNHVNQTHRQTYNPRYQHNNNFPQRPNFSNNQRQNFTPRNTRNPNYRQNNTQERYRNYRHQTPNPNAYNSYGTGNLNF